MLAKKDADENPLLAGFFKVLDTSVTVLGGEPIDYRAADERPPEKPQQIEEEPDSAIVNELELPSEQLLNAFARLKVLVQSPEPAPAELESLHLLVVSELAAKAKEARPFLSLDESGNLTLSSSHLAGLLFAHEVRTASAGPLSSSLKWIPKKLGLTGLVSRLSKDSTHLGPSFTNDRDLTRMCRNIEQAVSETIIVASECVRVRVFVQQSLPPTLPPFLLPSLPPPRHRVSTSLLSPLLRDCLMCVLLNLCSWRNPELQLNCVGASAILYQADGTRKVRFPRFQW
jgi:hypothetical protein